MPVLPPDLAFAVVRADLQHSARAIVLDRSESIVQQQRKVLEVRFKFRHVRHADGYAHWREVPVLDDLQSRERDEV